MVEGQFRQMFQQLPSTAAVLLLAAFSCPADAFALPRQTKTIEFHEINAVAFPPLPTEAPGVSLDELFRRQNDNTICGYLGGDSDLPATCSAGSHCVLDTDNQMVGCCPNGGSCTAGVFTGCVDRNSEPQTEVNPYIFTCSGNNVCYMNQFQGGFSQFGCGSASNLATSIATTAQGAETSLDLVTTSVEKTNEPSTLDSPTTIGNPTSSTTTTSPSTTTTGPTTGTDSPTTTNPGPTSDTTDSPTTTTSNSPTESPGSDNPTGEPNTDQDPAPDASEEDNQNVGTVVGGTIGGVAALALLVGGVFFLRKRRAHDEGRESPGNIGPIGPPMTQYTGPGPVHGAAFAPLNSFHEDDEHYNQPYVPGGAGYHDGSYNPQTMRSVPNHQESHLHYDPAHVPGIGSGLAPVAEEQNDSNPSLQDIDDFSRAYSAAGIGTMDEDQIPLTPVAPYDSYYARDSNSTESVDVNSFPVPPVPGPVPGPPPRSQRGSRPLWQQNRAQSRNLMWQ